METILTKTRTVLTRRPGMLFTFVQEPDEDGDIRRHIVTVDPQVLEDMGNPDTITVTIRPGDRLN